MVRCTRASVVVWVSLSNSGELQTNFYGWHTYSCDNSERAAEWLDCRLACTVSRHGPGSTNTLARSGYPCNTSPLTANLPLVQQEETLAVRALCRRRTKVFSFLETVFIFCFFGFKAWAPDCKGNQNN